MGPGIKSALKFRVFSVSHTVQTSAEPQCPFFFLKTVQESAMIGCTDSDSEIEKQGVLRGKKEALKQIIDGRLHGC